jgi:hypothetical protein
MRKLTLHPRWIAVFLGAAFSFGAMAADAPSFNNLSQTDYDSIVKELSANFTYSSITPASSLGGLGGFELGLVGGVTKDPNLKQIVITASPSTNLPNYVPHAGLLGRVGLPYGFTVEGLVFPSRTISNTTLQEVGGAVMWTATDAWLDELPFNLSGKFSYNHSKLSFVQNASGSYLGVTATVPVNVAYTDNEWAAQLIASKKLLFFEPYMGGGYVHSKGTLDLSTNGYTVNILNLGSASLNGSNTHAESVPTTLQFLAGLDIRLAFFSLGAEYQKSFAATTYTGRLSFRF